MQTLALAFAIFLLSLGALLNLTVLICLLWRVYRVVYPYRSSTRALVQQTLAITHR